MYVKDREEAKLLSPDICHVVREFLLDTPPLDAHNVDPFDIEVTITEKPVAKVGIPVKKRPGKQANTVEIDSDDEEPAAPAAGGDGEADAPEADPKDTKQYRHWGMSYSACAAPPLELFGEENINVCVGQKEVASTGWAHWQVCMSFKKPKRFNEVRNLLLVHAAEHNPPLEIKPIWLCHFNEKDGTAGLAKYRNYCKKSVDPKGGSVDKASRVEFGLKDVNAAGSKKGKRTDLTDYIAFTKEKRGRIDIMDEEVAEGTLGVIAKHPRFAQLVASRVLASQKKALEKVLCFWGATGTGKSTRARKYLEKAGYKLEEIYHKDPSDTWWQDYDPSVHRAVIVDEFGKAGTDPKVHTMWLQLTDVNNALFSSPVKGGSVVVNPEVVIFTSTAYPASWIQSWDHHDNGEQYVRRMQCFECKKVYQPVAPIIPLDPVLSALLDEMPLE